MRTSSRNKAVIGLLAILTSGLVFADEILTRDEMHPSIYEYPRPLLCKFIEEKDGTKIYGESFILTWAQLEAIETYSLVFKKDGKEYRVPAKSGYVCTALIGG